jgi:hypothetical protein
MQQPAIQAALNNLVEVIRTALMAEFLEYSRGGDAEPRGAKKGQRSAKGKKKASKKTSAKKISAKKAGARGSKP